jgi:photosystem II stability/assembly factor-like uncharacterized protein
LYAGTQFVGLWKSSDDGNSWVHIPSSVLPSYITSLAVDSSGRILLGSYEGLFVSNDSGSTWQQIQPMFPINAIIVTDSGSVAVGTDSGFFLILKGDSIAHLIDKTANNLGPGEPPSTPPSVISLAKGPNGDIFGGGGFWVWSNDGYGHWAVSATIINLSTFENEGGYVDYNDFLTDVDSFIYNGGEDLGLQRTRAGSADWQSSDFPAPATQCLITDTFGGIIVGTYESGIYRSSDTGKTWYSYNAGNTNGYTDCFAKNQNGTIIFAGSGNAKKGIKGGGVFRTSNYTSSVENHLQQLANEISCYPNPFSQSTQITFTSQAAGYAEVSIVNMLGVEIARLFSGELGAGEHSFSWSNPTGLPDGMYECLVRMNGQVQALPVVLMR